MEFKKAILAEYSSKMNEILRDYREEYGKILVAALPPNDTAESSELCNIKDEASDNCIEVGGDEPLSPRKFSKADTTLSMCYDNTPVLPELEMAVAAPDTVNKEVLLSTMDNSFNCTTESFVNGEFRRRARRRTGRVITKRKLEGEYEDACLKRRRTDSLESYMPQHLEIMKSRNITSKYEREIWDLKTKLKAAETERLEAEKIRKENADVSMRIRSELDELKGFKETIFKEIGKIEEVKRQLKDEKEKIYEERMRNERQQLEEAYRRETLKLDEDKRRMEERRLIELSRVQEEKRRLEVEKYNEIRRIMEEKAKLEKELAEQNANLERERRLLGEEREKMNQTFLELATRNEPGKRGVKIELPIGARIEIEKRGTIMQGRMRGVNETFQAAKREFQTRGVREPRVRAKEERIDAHFLYKQSIDAQVGHGDPKKFVPKTSVPFYLNEDEFESEEKRFAPALFTKDPRLSYTVKNQSHDEIRKFFGEKSEIDVESIFDQIENVSNFSPNKLKLK